MKVAIKKISLLTVAAFSFEGIAKAEMPNQEVSKPTNRSRWVGVERGTSALVGLSSLLVVVGLAVNAKSINAVGIVGVSLGAMLNCLVNGIVAASNSKKRKKSLPKAFKAGVLFPILWGIKAGSTYDAKYYFKNMRYIFIGMLGNKGLYDLYDLVKYGCSELESA